MLKQCYSYDVDLVHLNPDLFPNVRRWISSHPDAMVYVLHPDHKPDIEFPNLDHKALLPAIDAAREIKDSYEIGLIRKANDISSKAHTEILRHIRSLKTEAQVQALFEAVGTSHLANKQSYSVIAASGENASVLHYSANNEPFKDRQLLLIDAGVEWQLYASDITRTYPLSGTWTTEAEQIYHLVETMQESCIKLLKPGACMWDIHLLSIQIAIKGLLDLGILSGDPEQILNQRTYKAFYPHGLGHHVGLEVHDILGRSILSYKTTTTTNNNNNNNNSSTSEGPCAPNIPSLQAGMVITIEPGIYFNRYEMNRAYLNSPVHGKHINKTLLDRYWAVGGVRIEDDFLITEDGCENLTTAPKGDAALEIIREGKGGCECLF